MMASITTTLRLNDQMSRSLDKISASLKQTQAEVDGTIRKSVAFGTVAGNVTTKLLGKITELISKIPEIGDAYVMTQARLRLITNEGESVAEMNDKILKSAIASKSAYTDMAASVSKLGILAGDAFNNNTDEIIAFNELLNKSFKIGGAGIMEQKAGIYQLTQAMASGRLQGDEFRSIIENAPLVAKAIQKYMGVSQAELKKLSTAGEITAEVIKNALFESGDEINKMFARIPDTWGSSMQQIQSQLYSAFGGILGYLSGVVGTFIANFVSFVGSNIEYILAFLIAGAIVLGAIWIPRLWAMIPPLLMQFTMWALMNWPILVLIGSVTGLLLIFLKFPEVFGMLVGAASAAGTVIVNIFKGIGNAIIAIVNAAIAAMNHIPGVNLEPVKMFVYKSAVESYKEGAEVGTKGAKKLKTSLENFKSNFKIGTSGISAPTNIPSVPYAGGVPGGIGGIGSMPGGGKGLGKIGKGVGDINKKLGKPLEVKGEVQIEKDNLKWLLDLANYRQQKNYQQAPMYVNVNTGDINTNTDKKRLLRELENGIINAYEQNLVVT